MRAVTISGGERIDNVDPPSRDRERATRCRSAPQLDSIHRHGAATDAHSAGSLRSDVEQIARKDSAGLHNSAGATAFTHQNIRAGKRATANHLERAGSSAGFPQNQAAAVGRGLENARSADFQRGRFTRRSPHMERLPVDRERSPTGAARAFYQQCAGMNG